MQEGEEKSETLWKSEKTSSTFISSLPQRTEVSLIYPVFQCLGIILCHIFVTNESKPQSARVSTAYRIRPLGY